MARIAIDASRATTARLTGTEHYALELIRALIRHNRSHRFTLYFRDTPADDLLPQSDLVDYRVVPFWRAWTHLRFSAALWQDRPDVTFVPAHTLPFAFPGRAVVTVHDLGYKYYPQAHTRSSRLYLDLTTRYSARRATAILADSQATADDLSHFYNVPRSKIQVVYPGVAPPLISSVNIRELYNLPERYFVFIGTLQPRKNIARIVKAYAIYRSQVAEPAGLVMAGREGWLYDASWFDEADGVQHLGYIEDVDKGALYAGALALVFPTLYEGFGFPVIEAMHCGTPVIASTTSSLPELVGKAGMLVDPLDVDAIATAMRRLGGDPALRTELRQKGYEQAKRFTWDIAAQQTLQVLEEVAR